MSEKQEVHMHIRVEGLDLYCRLTTLADGKEHSMEIHEVAGEEDTRMMKDVRSLLIGLQRMRRPSRIIVHTSNSLLKNGIGYMDKWEKTGWLRSDRKPVKYVDLWKEIYKLSKPHEISVQLEGRKSHA